MAEDLIATLATIYQRAQQRGAISSGDEAWLLDNLGRVIEAMQDGPCHVVELAAQPGEPVSARCILSGCQDMAAPVVADALANARADVTHTMADLARVTHGRDVLADEVRTLTRDLCTAIDERDAALAERDAARVAVSALTVQLAGPVTAPGAAVVLHASARAGLTDALGGDSGAAIVMVGSHELDDLAASGQAYTLDGRYNLRLDYDRGGQRLKLAPDDDGD